MFDAEIRLSYDKGIKEWKIFEKEENYIVFRGWFHSPIFLVSERDLIDKRIFFNKNGKYYSFASSIENYQSPQDNVIRIHNYLNALILSEDQDNFYFNCYNQMDAKVYLKLH